MTGSTGGDRRTIVQKWYVAIPCFIAAGFLASLVLPVRQGDRARDTSAKLSGEERDTPVRVRRVGDPERAAQNMARAAQADPKAARYMRVLARLTDEQLMELDLDACQIANARRLRAEIREQQQNPSIEAASREPSRNEGQHPPTGTPADVAGQLRHNAGTHLPPEVEEALADQEK